MLVWSRTQPRLENLREEDDGLNQEQRHYGSVCPCKPELCGPGFR